MNQEFETRKGKVHDVCIAYIKEGTKNLEDVKEAFNAYCDVNGAHRRSSEESVIGWREIVASAVTIDCLHALDTDQVHKLEADLKAIARDYK